MRMHRRKLLSFSPVYSQGRTQHSGGTAALPQKSHAELVFIVEELKIARKQANYRSTYVFKCFPLYPEIKLQRNTNLNPKAVNTS